MTTPTSLDRLSLRSPDALISAVPYLLGFHPRESLVLVWLHRGRIALTQRVDLPAGEVDGLAWMAQVFGHSVADVAEELVAVFVTSTLPDHGLAEALVSTCDRREISVRDLLRVDDDRWWSLLCGDEECCPAEGRQLLPATSAEVAAEFTMLGCAPMPDRPALVSSLAQDPEASEAVAAVGVVRPPTRDRGLERWRDARVAQVLAAQLDPGPAAIARILSGLADVRVRDTVLWELARSDARELERMLDFLVGIVRAAPPGHVAPVATCLAAVAWLLGDGVRAAASLERAHADDPSYSLAALLQVSLQAGLPPSTWRDAMADLSREDCRFGVA
jgi:hypothetical protein